MIKRQAEAELLNWMSKSNKKPLVIRGARQVGKTQLVRSFCQSAKLKLIEINLEEITIDAFENENSFDTTSALAEISAITKSKITSDTVLFIDEIQNSKFAYSRLRFFYEKCPELSVIAAGSLLEVELRNEKISVPVGRVEYLYLGPLTFKEFLGAHNEEGLIDFCDNFPIKEMPLSIHNKLILYLRDFFFVGGMPEAVKRFIEGNKDYLAARSVHEEILQSYREDVRKYAKGKLATVLLEVFDKVPYILGEKVKYSSIETNSTEYVKEALNILNDIFIIQKVYHTNASGFPLASTEDSNIFKLYFLDVGLYNCLLKNQWHNILKQDEITLLNKGMIAEQFIAQELYLGSFQRNRIKNYYWLRDKKSQNAEVDFVIELDDKIIPIEVKAGKSGSIKSLLYFMLEKKSLTNLAMRFDLKHRSSIQENITFQEAQFKMISIPLYLISQYKKILTSFK